MPLQSHCGGIAMQDSRKPRGRARGAKSTVGATQVDGPTVRFSRNGDSYIVNVVHKYQQNLSSGNRRAILRKGNKWFFDAAQGGNFKGSAKFFGLRGTAYVDGLLDRGSSPKWTAYS